MKKQEPQNPFEHLKIQGVTDFKDAEPFIPRQVKITENKNESAIIITVKAGDYWYGGFMFFWHHGAVSYKNPDPDNGLFKTERDARLYYIAYLSLFLDYYIDDTKAAIQSALHEYSQQTLF